MRKVQHITPEMACAELMYITVPNEIDIEMNCSHIDAPPALHKGITIDLLSQLMKISYGIFQILTSINIILISILNNSLIFNSFH